MLGNGSVDLFSVFVMRSLDLSSEGKYMTVLIGSLIYSFTLFCHLSLLVVIATNRNLHCPMYFFLITLSINDLIGITATMPRVMSDVLSDNRHITYPACLIQAFCIHMYGGATLLILSIMAFDRYLAICHPLRYHCIMTKSTVLSLIASAWLIDFLLVGPLFVLTLRFPLCKTAIVNIYCDNQSLLKLTCATDTTVNNIYGLFITGLLHGVGLTSVVFSYSLILFTCFKSSKSDAKLKALQTCLFLFLEFNSCFSVLALRFEDKYPSLRNAFGLSIMVFPPILNPLLYGLKTKEIRQNVLQFYKRKVSSGK
uniref:Olfactory receptor n=1 Tax=Esox lucius TaxID=8010 RepID=A0A6Q2YCC5_ESOLU